MTPAHIPNPIAATSTMVETEYPVEKIPPTMSMGIHIIMPIQMKAMLIQLWRWSSGTWLSARFSITPRFDLLSSIRNPPNIQLK
jgi:hypothetical protein